MMKKLSPIAAAFAVTLLSATAFAGSTTTTVSSVTALSNGNWYLKAPVNLCTANASNKKVGYSNITTDPGVTKEGSDRMFKVALTAKASNKQVVITWANPTSSVWGCVLTGVEIK